MGIADSIFNYFIGSLALITTISSLLLYCRLYFPTTQLKLLDDLLVETKDIYRKANEEQLLPPKTSISAQTRLRRYEDESDTLREIVYRARTTADSICTLFQGHTRRIMHLADKVRELRSLLMTVSQKEKARKVIDIPGNRPSSSSEVNDAESLMENTQDEPRLLTHSSSVSQVCTSLGRNCDQSTDVNLDDLVETPQLLNTNYRTSCFVCSFVGWLARKSSPTEATLPSFVTRAETQSTICMDSATSRRSSTVIDEPLQKSTSRAWTSLIDWTFVRYQTADSITTSTPGGSLQPCHDSATSLPV